MMAKATWEFLVELRHDHALVLRLQGKDEGESTTEEAVVTVQEEVVVEKMVRSV